MSFLLTFADGLVWLEHDRPVPLLRHHPLGPLLGGDVVDHVVVLDLKIIHICTVNFLFFRWYKITVLHFPKFLKRKALYHGCHDLPPLVVPHAGGAQLPSDQTDAGRVRDPLASSPRLERFLLKSLFFVLGIAVSNVQRIY